MTSLSERLFAGILLAARLLFCGFRAHDQAITVDEATTYLRYLDGGWLDIYRRFDANNHVLYTILAKLSITLFGVSEFTLRLPSLIAGLFLMLAAVRLLERAPSAALRVTGLLAVALNPLLLDFSIAARGYSLSLALFFWGMEWLLRGRLRTAGLLLGLAAAANFSVVFPILALLLCAVALERWRTLQLLWPLLLSFAAVCLYPLLKAKRASFYLGYDSLLQALDSYVYTSLHARADVEGFFGTGEAARFLGFFLIPLTVAVLLWLRPARLADGVPLYTLVLTAFGFVLAHYTLGLQYPADRACMFFIPLLVVAWAIGFSGNRYLQLSQAVLCLAIVAQFATQLHGSYFQFWADEQDLRRIVTVLRESTASCAPESVRIGAVNFYRPSFEYYRKRAPIPALKEMEEIHTPVLSGYDFYALQWPSDPDLAKVKVLHRNELAGFAFATNPEGFRCPVAVP